MKNRKLPSNIEAEKSILGACFLSKYALQKAVEILNPEDFYDENNGIIFSTMIDLLDKKIAIDIITMTSSLKANNKLKEIGGVSYLEEIVDYVPTASNIDYYIQIVEEASLLRNLIHEAEAIAEDGYRTDLTTGEILDNSEKRILSVVKNKRSSEFRDIREVLSKAHSDLEKLSNKGSDVTGISTGWPDLDKVTTGLHPSELIIIAARPAMGKTAFALNLATHVAMSQNKSVALFNLEMSAEQLVMRMLASLGQVEGNRLRTGKLLNLDWKKINEASAQLASTNLVIDDTPGVTIGELRAKCRRLANAEKGLGLIVIDYLQLLSGGKNYGANRQQEVSDISRSLKTLALELGVPIIALSQLSRSVEDKSRKDKRPRMSDLRDSGSIEQDADIVMFLYRENYYNNNESDDTSISELIIGKNRQGPTTKIDLLFRKNTSTFLSLRKNDIS